MKAMTLTVLVWAVANRHWCRPGFKSQVYLGIYVASALCSGLLVQLLLCDSQKQWLLKEW